MSAYHLAQLNISRLLAPLESPQLADFVANLDRINALAEVSSGFVWRLQTDDGDATGIDFFGSDHIVNLSVWESVEDLHQFVYRSDHVDILRRKKEWFHTMAEAHMVLWWVPAGHLPAIEEAAERLNMLRNLGPTEKAFTFKKVFPAASNVPAKDRESDARER